MVQPWFHATKETPDRRSVTFHRGSSRKPLDHPPRPANKSNTRKVIGSGGSAGARHNWCIGSLGRRGGVHAPMRGGAGRRSCGRRFDPLTLRPVRDSVRPSSPRGESHCRAIARLRGRPVDENRDGSDRRLRRVLSRTHARRGVQVSRGGARAGRGGRRTMAADHGAYSSEPP